MSEVLTDAIVAITSADPSNSYFGTGFIILNDLPGCRIVTCAHVVRDIGPELVIAGGATATVVALGGDDEPDLAVLKVEKGLARSSLGLSAAGEKGLGFRTAGYQLFSKTLLSRALDGKLGEAVGLESRGKANRHRAWDLTIDGDHTLQPGYSGSPVVDKQSGRVVAVVSHRQGQGERGLAVSIESLKAIWPQLPDDLIEAKAVSRPSAESAVVTSRPTANEIKQSTLRKRLQALTEDVEALTDQFTSEINELNRKRMERRIESLTAEIAKVEAELSSIL